MISEFKAFAEMVTEKIRERCPSWLKVETYEMPQVNGCTVTVLRAREEQENKLSILYLDGYYEQFKEGASFDSLVSEMAERLKENEITLKDADWFLDLESVRDKIIFQVINREKNRELLSRIPHVPFCDLAVVFYVLIQKDDQKEVSALVQNQMMEQWGTTAGGLMELARVNTPRSLPASVRDMGTVLKDMVGIAGEGGYGISETDETIRGGELCMYMVTNTSGLNGAAVVFYPGVLKELSDKVGGDLVVLPSSRHEMIVIPYEENETDLDGPREMVEECNKETVTPLEFLSDHVYLYKRDEGALSII